MPSFVHIVANCALSYLSMGYEGGTYVLGVGELVLQFFYLVCELALFFHHLWAGSVDLNINEYYYTMHYTNTSMDDRRIIDDYKNTKCAV